MKAHASCVHTSFYVHETWCMETYNENLVLAYRGIPHDHMCKFEVIIELYGMYIYVHIHTHTFISLSIAK